MCSQSVSSSTECSCLNSGLCGTGMVNALSAVNAALAPIAVVSFPGSYAASSSVVFDASASTASCNRGSIASYAWAASGA